MGVCMYVCMFRCHFSNPKYDGCAVFLRIILGFKVFPLPFAILTLNLFSFINFFRGFRKIKNLGKIIQF